MILQTNAKNILLFKNKLGSKYKHVLLLMFNKLISDMLL